MTDAEPLWHDDQTNAMLANALWQVAQAEHRAAVETKRVSELAAVWGFKQAFGLRSFVDQETTYGTPANHHQFEDGINSETIRRIAASSNPAARLSLGYANSLAIDGFYSRLIRLVDHPPLVALLITGRNHLAERLSHYCTLSEEALEASPVARHSARFIIEHSWGLFGNRRRPTTNETMAIQTLFAAKGADRTINRIDRQLSSLPGMDNLTVMRDRVDAALGKRRHERKRSLLERWAKNL